MISLHFREELNEHDLLTFKTDVTWPDSANIQGENFKLVESTYAGNERVKNLKTSRITKIVIIVIFGNGRKI